MSTTTNLNLTKPEATENVDVSVLNENFDKIDNAFDYSTSEQRIGTWIDGKPLYRKVIDFGVLPNATNKSVAHGISNIENITKILGVATNGSGIYVTLPNSSPDALTYMFYLYATNTDVVIKTGSNQTSLTRCYITLEYTKTTE